MFNDGLQSTSSLRHVVLELARVTLGLGKLLAQLVIFASKTLAKRNKLRELFLQSFQIGFHGATISVKSQYGQPLTLIFESITAHCK